MFKPTSNYVIVWNLFATIFYLISIILDSLIIGFHLTPLLTPKITTMNTIISFLMLTDIILKFFIGIKAKSMVEKED